MNRVALPDKTSFEDGPPSFNFYTNVSFLGKEALRATSKIPDVHEHYADGKAQDVLGKLVVGVVVYQMDKFPTDTETPSYLDLRPFDEKPNLQYSYN